MQETKFRGVPVYMGGREYIVPSLSTRQFRQHYKLLTEPVSGQGEDLVHNTYERFIPLIGMAMRRNYPEINDDDLYDLLDLETFREVVAAIQNASGLRTVREGEAVPVARTSTGESSTHGS